MRECKCKADMEYVGSMGNDGRYWCPECGRYSQSYVCVPTEWKTPRNLAKSKASHAVLSEVRDWWYYHSAQPMDIERYKELEAILNKHFR